MEEVKNAIVFVTFVIGVALAWFILGTIATFLLSMVMPAVFATFVGFVSVTILVLAYIFGDSKN